MGIILNYMWGHVLISKSLGNDKHYLEILKLDLFAKFYDVLGHIIITKYFGQKCNFMNSDTVAVLNLMIISFCWAASWINQAANRLVAGICL